MKKALLMAITVCLLVCMSVSSTIAMASSMFGSIVAESKQQESDPLPSYTVFCGKPAVKVSSDDKTITHRYTQVSADSFEKFGDYLDKKGYAIWNQEEVNGVYIIELGLASKQNVISDTEDSFVIKYDPKQYMIEMVYPKTAKIQPYQFMNNMNYGARAEHQYTGSTTDQIGNVYEYSYAIDKGSVTFPLQGKYKTFTGTLAFPGERSYDSYRQRAHIEVYGDGKKLYVSPEIEITTYPVHFTLDVKECTQLEITWVSSGTNIWDNWGYNATIYNGLFY